ncbi:TIGR04255 family protein [Thalassospira sp. GB04J01]|uniref:TIGR04255 family protein n=1 Tax=Thalassospira sp. GB04J01 TaxID=1485225 RepID=UPI000C9BBA1D|nr:TIGR04255 family protein [Thalassospira sp. GB04J01]|tara:strand:+ start:855 stop:1649 length:795 start_codon:yes stop_codon:yes gene_type:complete
MPEFRPIYKSHAIEKCAATVAFGDQLPKKVFGQLLESATPLLTANGLVQGQQPSGFQFDVATGKVSPIDGHGPTQFSSENNVVQLHVLPDAIVWGTKQYLRWKNFRQDFQKSTEPLLSEFDKATNVSSIKLEYWDRFFWQGNWDDLDIKKLLKSDSELSIKAAGQFSREWHNHVGWFETKNFGRRLINVNIDLISINSPTATDQPSVGIYTMVHDQTRTDAERDELNTLSLIKRFDQIHDEMKHLLSQVLTPSASEMINLNSGE